MPAPKVSVITPTREREAFHPSLYECFQAQSLESRELLVLDDSDHPSPFFSNLSDPRVHYIHSREKMTLGDKRNALVNRAAGEVIAMFDDDDYYAPHYLQTMTDALGEADLVKFIGWYVASVDQRLIFYWDTSHPTAMHYRLWGNQIGYVPMNKLYPSFPQDTFDGFGFGFVFRRSICDRVKFSPKDTGEDTDFLRDLLRAGGKVHRIHDETCCVLHMEHGHNTSAAFPQFWLPPVLYPRLFPEVARRWNLKAPSTELIQPRLS
jgi:glycosyltransferase involved in cell wall biosynthesis